MNPYISYVSIYVDLPKSSSSEPPNESFSIPAATSFAWLMQTEAALQRVCVCVV